MNKFSKASETTRELVDTAILLALGVALKLLSDIIPFLNFLEGGTIDLAMLPIILIGYRNGYKFSFAGATLYWLLCWAIGGFKIYSGFPFVEILLDRFIPYTIGYGIAGLFYRLRESRLSGSLVILLCGFVRLASHTISGVILWYSWTGFKGFMTSFWASLIYNGGYVGITTALAIVLFNFLFKVAYYKAPLSLPHKTEEVTK